MTIRDIAREADVSVATVSRLINKSGPVGESTRTRIQTVIDKYGYRPNVLARSLYTKKTGVIGLLIPDITNMFFSQLCLEIERSALVCGYSVFLCNTMNDTSLETHYLQKLTDRQVDGILFTGGRINRTVTDHRHLSEMKKIASRVPIVMINGKMDGMDCRRVRSDEYGSVFTMVEYLVGLGHSRIGMIGGVTGVTSFDMKKAAFLECARKGKFPLNGKWLIEGNYSVDSGMKSMEDLLLQKDLPTAVITINDLVAIGALKVCEHHGLSVPDDISIIGFDDIPIAGVVRPALTTMAHPYAELGKRAVWTVDELMNDRNPPDDALLEMNLVVRESCRSI